MSRKRSAAERHKPWRRHLKTTREGKLLILVTLGLGFGAINTGNNLLYLVLGMMLSLIVVSGILSEQTLRGLQVVRRYHDGLYAGRETFLSLEVTNTKRRRSSFSVELEECFEATAAAVQRRAYTLMLRGGETRSLALRVTFSRRGLVHSDGILIGTRFPFGFFRKWRVAPDEVDLLVYPEVHPVRAPPVFAFREGDSDARRRVGRGEEYHGLREHQSGDDPRDIHWKSSARQGRLVTREYDAASDRRVWLIVPNVAPDEGAEAAISEAASLAAHYADAGWAVGVRTLDGSVAPASGPGHLMLVLAHLARVPVYPAGTGFGAAPPRSGERLLVRHATQRTVAVDGTFDRIHELEAVT